MLFSFSFLILVALAYVLGKFEANGFFLRNSSTDFYEVMDMLDKRLNDKGKNWRHVLKSLKVLDYCLHEGSELVVTWARKNIYIIKTLREFIYLDEDGRDVGAASKYKG
jgi:epsin